MEKEKYKTEDEVDEIIKSLVGLPSQNLEKRIQELEQELDSRKTMLDNALSMLGTHQLRLEDKISRLKYASIQGLDLSRKANLEKENLKTEIRKLDEWNLYFRDVSNLRDKLREAREELAMEREKEKLVDF